MKKLPIIVFAILLVSAAVSMTSCGPSAAEKARQDSIRIADSLRRVDSIKIADSLKAVVAAEEEANALREKVDKEAENIKARYKVKFPSLGKIAYAPEAEDMFAKDYVYILNVATGEKKTIVLPGSDEWGSVVEMHQKGDDKTVVVALNNIGNLPMNFCYDIDVEKEKVIRSYEEF